MFHVSKHSFKNNKINIQLINQAAFESSRFLVSFVLRIYGPVNPMGHVERGQFT